MPQTGAVLTPAGLTGARLSPAGLTPLVKGIAGIYLPGVAGNYASAPDSAALSIMGDITIDVWVALDNWVPSSSNSLVAEWNTGGAFRSYQMYMETTGKLSFHTSVDGTANIISAATVTTGFANGALSWLRGTFQANDGSGHNIVKFYTSSDGVTWVQLGTTVTNAGTTSLFNGVQPLEIGSINSGAASLASGIVRAVRVYSSYLQATAGTPVFAVDFSTKQPGANTLRDSAGGALVTINGTQWRDSYT